MKTILVTGIDGFLGYNFYTLFRKKYKFIGFVRDIKNLKRLAVNQLPLYDNMHSLQEHISKNEVFAILHCATVYEGETKDLHFTNIHLPVSLFEMAGKYGVALFLNSDTFSARLSHKYDYLLEYNQSKKTCRQLLEKKSSITKLVNMVIHHMYGPYDSGRKFIMKLFEVFMNSSIQSFPLTVGENKRDFIHVNDVATAFDIVLENYKTIPSSTSIDVCTNELTRIRDCVELVRRITQSQVVPDYGRIPMRKGEPDMENIVYSNEYLRLLGWLPQFNLKEGLLALYKMYSNG